MARNAKSKTTYLLPAETGLGEAEARMRPFMGVHDIGSAARLYTRVDGLLYGIPGFGPQTMNYDQAAQYASLMEAPSANTHHQPQKPRAVELFHRPAGQDVEVLAGLAVYGESAMESGMRAATRGVSVAHANTFAIVEQNALGQHYTPMEQQALAAVLGHATLTDAEEQDFDRMSWNVTRAKSAEFSQLVAHLAITHEVVSGEILPSFAVETEQPESMERQLFSAPITPVLDALESTYPITILGFTE